MMKYALPTVTLILCLSVLLWQRSAIATIEKGSESLRSRIDVAETGSPRAGAVSSGPEGVPARPARRNTPRGDDTLPQRLADLDLERLARVLEEAESGGGQINQLRTTVRIQQLILNATPEELEDLMHRMGELDVPAPLKNRMMHDFAGALAEHDPRKAIELLVKTDQFTPERNHWRLSELFAKWAQEEPQAAVAWFDRELAGGRFEAKSLEGGQAAIRHFQAAAIGATFVTDPSGARQRLLALPEQDRASVLRDHRMGQNTREHPVEMASLVRDSITDERLRAQIFDAHGRHLIREGYDAVSGYVDQIDATPGERVNILERTARQQFGKLGNEGEPPTTEDVAELQRFLQSHSYPETARMTGQSLAQFGDSGNDFAHALGLVTQLHDQTPDDALLTGFLGAANGMKDEERTAARELANRIQNPEKRRILLEQLQ